MNANELADLMEDMYPSVATMLRQLQAENEALKKQLYPTPKEFIGVSKDGLPMFKEERNDAGFYMSDAEHYKLKCASQQAEIEAVKESNKNLMELVTMLREELDKARQEVLMWENAEMPPETMADIIEKLERRGFITK